MTVCSWLACGIISQIVCCTLLTIFTPLLNTGWVTETWQVLKRNKLVPMPVRRDVVLSVTRLPDAILVAMEQWIAAHCLFIVETFLKMATFCHHTEISISTFHIMQVCLAAIKYVYGYKIAKQLLLQKKRSHQFLCIQWEHHRTSRLWGRQCLGVLITQPKNVLLPCIYPIAVYEEYCTVTWTFILIKW